MDALGSDIYGHHEGREEVQRESEQESSSSLFSLFASSTRRLSASRSSSSSSRPSGVGFSRAIGATDFHLYNQDATGFDEESSSENSSRETTVDLKRTLERPSEEQTTLERKNTTTDEDSIETDGMSVRSRTRNEPEDVATALKLLQKGDSSSADSEELKAERRFMRGEDTDLDVMLATASYGDDQDIGKDTKLVGVLGRDFDEPLAVAQHLQKELTDDSRVMYRPVIIPRHELLSSECLRYVENNDYDVVVFCYNTSEARILLTGQDGFYTSLLQHTAATLGENTVIGESNVVFVLTHCHTAEGDMIDNRMKQRISEQPAMRPYVNANQVYSWYREPSKQQREHIMTRVLNSQKQTSNCVIL